MKKLFAVLLVVLMMFGSVFAYAETADTPPSLPDGASAPADGSTPPEGMTPPDGEGPPDLPDGMTPPDGMGAPPDGMPGGVGGGSHTENSGTGATVLTENITESGTSYTSSAADENALRVENSATVAVTDITVTKTESATNSEDSAFYGLGAAVLVRDGAHLSISGGTIETDASGANGVFAYGTGAASVSDVTIRTSQGNSGGVMLAGGGTLTASNLDIETQGPSSAAIRTDRGGGSMAVDGGTYVTNGVGSPAVYSTAVVTVSNATLTANHSEAVVVEGKNSVALTDCTVTGNMTESNGGAADNLHTVMIYQSMSGDADVGRSDFAMTGGSLTSLTGDTFYVTNTSCTIELSGVQITNADGALLTIAGNTSSRGWGTEGANGGTCDVTAVAQVLEGEIIVDEISALNLNLVDGSSFTGTINQGADAGQVDVTLSADSTWTLTADAHISSFDGNLDGVNTNGFSLYVGGTVAK